MDKKKWVRPILTVLLRSMEESTVLYACKTHLVWGPAYVNCTMRTGGQVNCRPAEYFCGCENLPPPPPGEAWMCVCCQCATEQHS